MKRLSCCRLCGGALDQVLELEPMPLPDDYGSGPTADLYPTELMQCEICSLVQLGVVIEPRRIFGPQYAYRTGFSPGLVRHFGEYADEMIARAHLTASSFVVDIGANDGTLLRAFKDRCGCHALGIDPAGHGSDFETVLAPLDEAIARDVVSRQGQADLVTANNVLAHVDDVVGLLRAVRLLVRPGGLFVCEVGSLTAMLDGLVWETIYHEHLSYFTMLTLSTALRGAGFNIVTVTANDTHGGSLQFVCRVGHPAEPDLWRPREFHRFAVLRTNIIQRREALARLGVDGPTMAIGASAKAAVILHQTGLRPAAVVDDNPAKQGKHMPGTVIPIVDRDALSAAGGPVLVLAWNEAPAIAASLPEYAGRLVVAAPEPYLI